MRSKNQSQKLNRAGITMTQEMEPKIKNKLQ